MRAEKIKAKIMDEEEKEVPDRRYITENWILKQFGYFYHSSNMKGEKPEDIEDVKKTEVDRIVEVLQKHPICPKKKIARKIKYEDVHCLEERINWRFHGKSVYFLGDSYSLKHIVAKFLSHSYCTNGDFIAACIEVGFIVVPIKETPNAFIYIPQIPTVQNDLRYYITVV